MNKQIEALKMAKQTLSKWGTANDELACEIVQIVLMIDKALEEAEAENQEPVLDVVNGEAIRSTLPEGFTGYLYTHPALAEVEKQEPAAWMIEYREDEFDYWHKNCDEDKLALEMWFDAIRYDTTEYKIYPLYTHPATWQSLSDDEIQSITWKVWGADALEPELDYARAIEKALKEKNHD